MTMLLATSFRTYSSSVAKTFEYSKQASATILSSIIYKDFLPILLQSAIYSSLVNLGHSINELANQLHVLKYLGYFWTARIIALKMQVLELIS